MSTAIELFDDSLLGGAAMSLDDLKIVESQEIRWLFVGQESEKDEFNSQN
ncbi:MULTISPECIES: hypothetical protein [Prochlorococcus]|nr:MULTISPECIES: hypothetical protein [Prochlorococcus]KGG14373.1 hypothetical protein EV04_0226 [Prochlorococcus marinus str. LG]KGG22053.1 hypothetical protein EV08_0227 [Prochlorococcus marinus str. SS2]KGG24629.1 hypothetical protein EV09_0261 [Prochlorococcus marinus str. SS35]KGG33522.1 hypothetical protein EV10_0731 [Prochlorococcus marinus str. SS51]KGG36241.1 hypothetical protein EV11_0932 [Prochlorococcus sp. SS52]